MWSMSVVPVEERSEFPAKSLPPPRHDRRPTEEIGLEREDESLDDRNATVSTDGVVAGPHVPVAAPLAKSWIVELRTAVADDVLRRCTGIADRPATNGSRFHPAKAN